MMQSHRTDALRLLPVYSGCYTGIMGKTKKSVYAVARGRVPGTYNTWDECKAQVNGFSGAKFEGFHTRTEAEV